SGIDVGGILRAAIANYQHHHIQQGGSTISQQLIKQVYIGSNAPNDIQRKMKEAILAIELNREYSKNQILEMYLNTIFYGSQTYVVDYVLKTLAKEHGINSSDQRGYRVYTSLDLNLQHMAEKVVRDQVAQKGSFYNFHDAALVSMDPKTGQVLAMVGGVDYNRPGGQFNFAYDVARPPGSSFKIFTYTAAIESRKVNMLSPVQDAPMVFPI